MPWDLDLTWANNMYGGGGEPFRDRVLPRPAFAVEYRNRVREIRDLLYNSEQTGMMIDEFASVHLHAGTAVVGRCRPRDVGLQPDPGLVATSTRARPGTAASISRRRPTTSRA